MRNELSDRQQAIRMRLAGDSVSMISYALRRSGAWVRKWWQRYLAAGGEGLSDLSHAHANLLHRTPPHIEQAILAIRRRLVARATHKPALPWSGQRRSAKNSGRWTIHLSRRCARSIGCSNAPT